ncbi:selenium cofactor biosynthesis protein YqeC [Oscillibacter sp.]|uniref:selenium cofactor biosynthesis protein YqeC n=1 Tax=Oscillibacter sp. TaxID=1945593 RepID=UPI001B710DE4|nr:selenium cofactor biosynthesis protein YqeC [Oscillibacter sp.]MBP3510230.1 putative selenium-dependent hydroxylase accessory protein YqeC [Oscillibacter sp.]
MELAKLLDVHPGVTAVIGGGGKTTLLRTLGEELAERNRVLLCTTTKIFPFPGLPCANTREELDALRREHRLLCAGTPVSGTGKLTAPSVHMTELVSWFDYVLVEADGSAQRPFKAHAAHEPVIPAEANQVIFVVGACGFGRPVEEVVHRPELYACLAGVSVEDAVTPETEAAVLRAEGLHHRIYVNQTEAPSDLAAAKALAALLDCPVLAGSLHRREYFVCSL